MVQKRKTHKRNTKQRRNTKRMRKKKRTHKRKVQKGGFAPCIPCLAPVAAFAGGALGGASFMMKKTSSSSNINGKRSVKRKEKYEINKDGEIHKREFKQINKRVYDGKKMSEYDTLKQANKAYNDLIKRCKSKGFKKC